MICSIVKMDVEVPTVITSLVVVVKSERNSAHSTRKVLVLSWFSYDVGGRYTTARLTEELFITRLHIKYSNCTYFTTSFVLILRLFMYILIYMNSLTDVSNSSSSLAIVSVNWLNAIIVWQ